MKRFIAFYFEPYGTGDLRHDVYTESDSIKEIIEYATSKHMSLQVIDTKRPYGFWELFAYTEYKETLKKIVRIKFYTWDKRFK